jgi:hypothetical protein
LNDAGDRVAEIEQRWAGLVGQRRFDSAARTLQHIIDYAAVDTDTLEGRPEDDDSGTTD